ncbi:MAG: hypothetical protein WD512_06435 [Candidatus Paceibacterota bacterium]
MKLYRIKTENDKLNIFEIQTEQVVKSFSIKEEDNAKKFLKRMKGGFGFNGWTPPFFLIDIGEIKYE